MEYLRKTSLVLTSSAPSTGAWSDFSTSIWLPFLFGSMSILSRIIYMLVGLSALVVAYSAATCCRTEEHFVKEISK